MNYNGLGLHLSNKTDSLISLMDPENQVIAALYRTSIGSDIGLAPTRPLFELMMANLLMHICVTWPQWVNTRI